MRVDVCTKTLHLEAVWGDRGGQPVGLAPIDAGGGPCATPSLAIPSSAPNLSSIAHTMQVVLPGDAVMQDVLLDDSNHRIKIGPGVAQLPPGSGSSSISGARAIAATRSGLLGVTSSSSAASQSSSSSSSKLTSADRTEPQLQTQTCWVESQAKRVSWKKLSTRPQEILIPVSR